MNFLVGTILYHAPEEYIAFWILKIFFDELELRDIYLPSNYKLIINKIFILINIFN
jgi:hypothetical protein